VNKMLQHEIKEKFSNLWYQQYHQHEVVLRCCTVCSKKKTPKYMASNDFIFTKDVEKPSITASVWDLRRIMKRWVIMQTWFYTYEANNWLLGQSNST
jgi:hypothetical protein